MKLNQKNSILLVGFLLLVWGAYIFSFSKTIEAKQRYNELKQEDELFTSASQNIHSLKQQDVYYNSILSKHQISTESSFQSNLLNSLNVYSQENKLKIIGFKDSHLFQLSNNAIQKTYIFTVESDYNSIIKLIYNLEQEHKFGKIISVDFEKKKNYKTFNKFLQCTIFLQKVSQE